VETAAGATAEPCIAHDRIGAERREREGERPGREGTRGGGEGVGDATFGRVKVRDHREDATRDDPGRSREGRRLEGVRRDASCADALFAASWGLRRRITMRFTRGRDSRNRGLSHTRAGTRETTVCASPGAELRLDRGSSEISHHPRVERVGDERAVGRTDAGGRTSRIAPRSSPLAQEAARDTQDVGRDVGRPERASRVQADQPERAGACRARVREPRGLAASPSGPPPTPFARSPADVFVFPPPPFPIAGAPSARRPDPRRASGRRLRPRRRLFTRPRRSPRRVLATIRR
jgi:hypothetical protein